MTEAASVRGEDIFIVGGGELGRSGGDLLRQLSPAASRCSCAARPSRRACPTTSSSGSSATPNIEMRYHTAVDEVCGNEHLEAVVLRDTGDRRARDRAGARHVRLHRRGAADRLAETTPCCCDERGFRPHRSGHRSQPAKGSLAARPRSLPARNERSRRLRGRRRPPRLRQARGTAVGEGAMAVMSVWQYRAQAGL